MVPAPLPSQRALTQEPAGEGPFLAIDIGGTKLDAGIVDAEGRVLTRTRAPTPPGVGADALLDEVVRIARESLDVVHGQVVACGIGCVGPMEGDTVSPLNLPAWREFPLRSTLADRLSLDVAVDNDAKALALGEGWLGAAKGARNYLAMVVSTGVGGGLVLDGRLLDGRLGNAGHVGHVIVEPEGRTCPCGARGCLEAEASGRAIAEATGRPPALADPALRERCGRMVGRAVASVASLLDLDLVVVGGSVALGYGASFFDAARAELATRARLAFSRDCRLVPVGLGDEGPLVGAAAVAMRARGAAWVAR